MNEIYHFKYVGFVSFVLFLAAVFIILTRVTRVPSWSASQHAASDKKVWIFYELVLSTALIFFYLFSVKWFIPHFNLPTIFTILLTTIIIMQLIGNCFPDKNDRSLSTRLHRSLYYISASFMPVLLILIANSANFSSFSRILTCAAIVVNIIFAILFFFVKKSHEKFLWYQISYFLLFLAVIFSSAYLTI